MLQRPEHSNSCMTGSNPSSDTCQDGKQAKTTGVSKANRPKLPRPSGPPPQCPRCSADPSNTKFCYYNNYNINQPRYYCKVRVVFLYRPLSSVLGGLRHRVILGCRPASAREHVNPSARARSIVHGVYQSRRFLWRAVAAVQASVHVACVPAMFSPYEGVFL